MLRSPVASTALYRLSSCLSRLEQHDDLTLSSSVRSGLRGTGERSSCKIDPPLQHAELGGGLRHRVIDLVRPASLWSLWAPSVHYPYHTIDNYIELRPRKATHKDPNMAFLIPLLLPHIVEAGANIGELRSRAYLPSRRICGYPPRTIC